MQRGSKIFFKYRDDALCGFSNLEAERTGDMLFDCLSRSFRIELDLTAQKIVRIDVS